VSDERRRLIEAVLACPRCRRPIRPQGDRLGCACGAAFRMAHGTPVFLAAGASYVDRRHVSASTNPYSPKSLELIRSHPRALILDFGAGNPSPEETFDNVVRMDFVHYRSGDVVSTERNLPFLDEAFDFVVSESVFEHVREPWHYASELHRVLKRGGRVMVDSAFLQPVHGDPDHFFNMTLFGLEEIFGMFRRLDSGVEPYQSAGMTMNILLRTFLSLVENEQARKELETLFGTVDFVRYDAYIPAARRGVMAAGVYFVGAKD
jgi:SAM-dependent methyltransferase